MSLTSMKIARSCTLTPLMFHRDGGTLSPFPGAVISGVQHIILIFRKVVFRPSLILKWYQRMNFQQKVQKNR